MATETKVGLLAGLAFIVCFAVILANRGQTRRYTADTGLEPAIGQRLAAPRDAVDRLTNAGAAERRPDIRVAAFGPLETSAPPQHAPRRPTRSPVRLDTHVPTVSGAEVEWRSADDEAYNHASLPSPIPTGGSRPYASDRQHDAALTARNTDADDATAALAALLQRRAARRMPTPSDPNGPVQRDRRAQARPNEPVRSARTERGAEHSTTYGTAANARTYRVAPGDTLTSIARRYYGAGTHRYLTMILDANRAVLANPDRLTVGMVLALPNVNREPTPAASRTPVPGRAARRGRAGSTVRWYQVRKNDRYVSIARSQLGDASRWRELFELNKDKFPDPDQIREGVRIKLPSR